MPRGVYKRKPVTEEARRNISIAMMGRKPSIKSIQKLIERNKTGIFSKGRKFTEEHKRKISEANKGKPSKLKDKKLSVETRIRMSEAQQKVVAEGRHPFWRGGVNKINLKIRGSLRYRLWREAVFERDDFTCQFCNKRGYKINADHIKPFSLYPELRFELSNGRTLCVDCHRKTDTYGNQKKKR